MLLTRLELNNFRNFEHISVSFSDGLNMILGKNAQGKSNLLEAITVCAIGKSYRNAKNDDMVMHQRNSFFVKCVVSNSNIDKTIEVFYKKGNKKYIRLNGNIISNIDKLFGNLNVVVFIPDDLKLLKQGPYERRRFVDIDLIQIKPDYYYNLIQYSRVLKQRNNLLKKQSRYDMISIWDDQLVLYGSKIIKERMSFVEKISRMLKEIYLDFMPEAEKVHIKYFSNVIESEYIEEDYRKKLKQSIERDMRFKTTTCGPHRDDIRFFIDGLDARYFASQGQQRSLILSLKLVEMEIMKNDIGEYPVLLLDDVLSELDFERQQLLLKALNKYQTIMTGTHIDHGNDVNVKKYLIENKSIKEL